MAHSRRSCVAHVTRGMCWCDDVAAQLSISSTIDVYVSGSTGVFGILQDRKLLVGNVGDSRAVLGRRTKTGGVKALELSTDQKPNRYVTGAEVADGRTELAVTCRESARIGHSLIRHLWLV